MLAAILMSGGIAYARIAGVTKLHKPHYQNKYHGMHLFIAIITIGETALLLSDAAQVRGAQRHGSAVPRPVGNI